MMPEPNPGINAAGEPPSALVYLPMPAPPTVYENYLSKQSIASGIAQIAIGVLCIIFNAIAVFNPVGFIGNGIWCGAIFLVTGGFGMAAGKTKRKCQVIAYMVLCLISVSFTIALFAIGVVGMQTYKLIPAVTQGLLAAAAIVEAIVALYGAIICCKSGPVCCGNPDQEIGIPGSYTPNNGQLIFISQTQAGQCVYLPQSMLGYAPGSVVSPPSFVSSNAQSGFFIPFPHPQSTIISSTPPEPPPEYTAEYTEEYTENNKTADDTNLLSP